jgi:hypothetical protein
MESGRFAKSLRLFESCGFESRVFRARERCIENTAICCTLANAGSGPPVNRTDLSTPLAMMADPADF